MQISCPNCSKIFEVNDNLIPLEGRLVQCGSCDHKWFYKNTVNKSQEEKIQIKSKIISDEIKISDNSVIEKTPLIKKTISIPITKNTKKKDKIKHKKVHTKNVKSKFKFFLVLIISILAMILLIDTFKMQISIVFPEIIKILNNLYESLTDIYLFFKDLIK